MSRFQIGRSEARLINFTSLSAPPEVGIESEWTVDNTVPDNYDRNKLPFFNDRVITVVAKVVSDATDFDNTPSEVLGHAGIVTQPN